MNVNSIDAKRIYASAKAYCAGRCVAVNKGLQYLTYIFVHNRTDRIIHYVYRYDMHNDTFRVHVDTYRPREWNLRN